MPRNPSKQQQREFEARKQKSEELRKVVRAEYPDWKLRICLTTGTLQRFNGNRWRTAITCKSKKQQELDAKKQKEMDAKKKKAQELQTILKTEYPTWELRISTTTGYLQRHVGNNWETVCKHGKRPAKCREGCGGAAYCEHGKQKSRCGLGSCNGTALCEHGRGKYNCTTCGTGAGVCEHGRERRLCRTCGGQCICSHNKVKYDCIDCAREQNICEHNKLHKYCTICKPFLLCEHGIHAGSCKKCSKWLCPHKNVRHRCFDCGATSSHCKSNQKQWNNICPVTANKNYDGFCTHCFANLFPDDPRTPLIRRKSKENTVVAAVTNRFEGFVHDKTLWVDLEGGCCASRRRIDLRILVDGTLFCIEVDEHQHKDKIYRLDDDNRYNDLFMDFSGKYVFLRYNPDGYKTATGKRKNPPFDERTEVLFHEIERHMTRITNGENVELLEIHHLFYDE